MIARQPLQTIETLFSVFIDLSNDFKWVVSNRIGIKGEFQMVIFSLTLTLTSSILIEKMSFFGLKMFTHLLAQTPASSPVSHNAM